MSSTSTIMFITLKESPKFVEELEIILGTQSKVYSAYRILKKQGYHVNKFLHRFRTQESRIATKKKYGTYLKQGRFIIFWLEGSEIQAINRIEEKYDEYLTKKEWRDIYIPILGPNYRVKYSRNRGDREIIRVKNEKE